MTIKSYLVSRFQLIWKTSCLFSMLRFLNSEEISEVFFDKYMSWQATDLQASLSKGDNVTKMFISIIYLINKTVASKTSASFFGQWNPIDMLHKAQIPSETKLFLTLSWRDYVWADCLFSTSNNSWSSTVEPARSSLYFKVLSWC